MEEPAVERVEAEGDCRKEEGKEVLPAGEGMEPVEVSFEYCGDWAIAGLTIDNTMYAVLKMIWEGKHSLEKTLPEAQRTQALLL